MDDATSPTTDAPASEAPAQDSIVDPISDTDDQSEPTPQVDKPSVEETSEEPNAPEVEAEPEAENQPEANEDLQPEVDPKEEARRRYEERQRARDESRQRIQQQTEQYVSEADDEYEQRLRAMEVQSYVNQVENTQNSLIGEFERAKANPDLQIFNPENKEAFDERAYNKAMKDYNNGYVQYDQNGNMIGIKGSLYEHLTETADLLKASVKSGAVQQVRATKNMRSNADTKPAAQPRQTQRNTIDEILLSD